MLNFRTIDVKLTQLESTHDNVRTKEIVGFCFELPKVGRRFTMFGESLDKRLDIRMLNTSPVRKITKRKNILYLKTENSSYKLEVALGERQL